MSVTVQEVNQVPQLLRAIEELNRKRLEIGIFGGDSSENFILMIARVHEFGVEIQVTEKMRRWYAANAAEVGLKPLKKSTNTIKIPERSFIRSYFDDNENKIAEKTENMLAQVIALQMSTRDFWEGIGLELSSKVSKQLIDIKDPSNHPLTIRNKKSANPLMDEGRLAQAITWRVADDI